MDEKLDETIDVLKNNESFLIAGHEHPDGDCVGSEIALALLLKRWDKDVHIYNPDRPDQIYYFLPYIQWVKTELPDEIVDVVIVVDSGDLDRIGPVADYAEDAKKLINIDHHPESFNVGDINLVEPEMSSVGEIIYWMYKRAGEPLSKEAAQVLYISLVTDTGSFRYANTRAESHEAAADLIKNGYIDPYRIYSMLYERETFDSTKLMGKVLSDINDDDGIIWAEVPLSMFEENGTEYQDLKPALKHMRSIDSCQVAVLLQERPDGTIKINFRAKSDFNLLTVANQFGGGGHEKAAGATVEGDLQETRKDVIRSIKEAMPQSLAV